MLVSIEIQFHKVIFNLRKVSICKCSPWKELPPKPPRKPHGSAGAATTSNTQSPPAVKKEHKKSSSKMNPAADYVPNKQTAEDNRFVFTFMEVSSKISLSAA